MHFKKSQTFAHVWQQATETWPGCLLFAAAIMAGVSIVTVPLDLWHGHTERLPAAGTLTLRCARAPQTSCTMTASFP
jgi:hypothetical protein